MALNANRVARSIAMVKNTLARLEKYVEEAGGEAPVRKGPGAKKAKVEKAAAKGGAKKGGAPKKATGKRGPKAVAEKPSKKEKPVKKGVKAAPAKGKKVAKDDDFPTY